VSSNKDLTLYTPHHNERVDVVEKYPTDQEVQTVLQEVATAIATDPDLSYLDTVIDTVEWVDPNNAALLVGHYPTVVGSSNPSMYWISQDQTAVVVQYDNCRVHIGDAVVSHLFSIEFALAFPQTIFRLVRRVLDQQHTGCN